MIFFDGLDSQFIINTFESTARNLKVKLELNKVKGGNIDPRRGLDVIVNLIDKAVDSGSNICLIIIPNFMKQQYKKIKEKALLDSRIVCQVAVDRTLQKKNAQSIVTKICLLYTSPSPRDQRGSRMPSSA